MSQSLHAIKRFRLREIIVASPKARTPPAATASASNQPQRLAATTAAASLDPSSRSSSNTDVPTAAAIFNNPFVPHKNPKSGRWALPKYSLRRQADLVKHARESGTLHLLPPGPKLSEAQQLQQLEALAAAAGAPSSTLPAGAAETEEQEVGEVVASGLVSVRRGQEREREQEQEQEQGLGEGTQGTQGEEEEGGRGWRQDSSKDVAANTDDAWTKSVEWVGTVRERSVAGADVGNRLYAGKKRMFKGHKWERERERRVARTKMMLRDMDKRVQRFKGYRAKGKPLPLARRSNVLKKTQKLPF